MNWLSVPAILRVNSTTNGPVNKSPLAYRLAGYRQAEWCRCKKPEEAGGLMIQCALGSPTNYLDHASSMSVVGLSRFQFPTIPNRFKITVFWPKNRETNRFFTIKNLFWINSESHIFGIGLNPSSFITFVAFPEFQGYFLFLNSMSPTWCFYATLGNCKQFGTVAKRSRRWCCNPK